MNCLGNCAACPMYYRHKKKKVNQVAEAVEAKNEIEESSNNLESAIESTEMVPVYNVKKTLTGKLKGVLQG